MLNPKWPGIIEALKQYDARQTGPSEYRSRCPGHKGENPTSCLWSYDEQTGKISVKCFAQDCSAEEIMKALDFRASDLYPPQEMTEDVKARIAQKKAERERKELDERFTRASVAVGLGLDNEFDPGTSLTDRANAQRFIKRHGHKARYCAQLSQGYSPKSWFIYDGSRWAQDVTDEVFRLADEIRRTYDFLAAEEEDEEKRRAWRKIAGALENKARVQAMIETAAKFLPITMDDFDQDPWLLNVKNGTIDLTTGERLPHDPAHFITKLAPVEYDPEAEAPMWQGFLDRIFDGNENLIRFVQKAIGYALTGSTREQVVFFLYGTGRNGKSTLINTVQALLGDYAMHTPTTTLMSRKSEGVPNDVARLKGARFVSAVEAESGRRLSEPFIKQLSGGDVITARFMRAEWFEFRPQFKLFFATNHKPIIRGTDLAIWRRIRLIPFNVTIPEDEVDPDLGQKLLQELPGILNWAIEGCLVWQKEGLGLPAEVAEATEAYRNEMDVLGGFFDECCILNPLARVTKRDFYEAYVQWAERSRETVLSQRKIGMMMMERGFTEVRLGAKSERYWQGVGLADTTDITDTNSIIRQRQGPSREKRNDVSDVSDVSASGTRVTRLPL